MGGEAMSDSGVSRGEAGGEGESRGDSRGDSGSSWALISAAGRVVSAGVEVGGGPAAVMQTGGWRSGGAWTVVTAAAQSMRAGWKEGGEKKLGRCGCAVVVQYSVVALTGGRGGRGARGCRRGDCERERAGRLWPVGWSRWAEARRADGWRRGRWEKVEAVGRRERFQDVWWARSSKTGAADGKDRTGQAGSQQREGRWVGGGGQLPGQISR